MLVAVVDYGSGNLRSAAKAFEHEAGDARVVVTSDPAQVASADAARRDWETAHRMAANNDKYRDLVARTAADQHATMGEAALVVLVFGVLRQFRSVENGA